MIFCQSPIIEMKSDAECILTLILNVTLVIWNILKSVRRAPGVGFEPTRPIAVTGCRGVLLLKASHAKAFQACANLESC